MSKKLSIRLKSSTIGRVESQKRTAVALGLTKLNRTVIKDDTPEVRGMIRKIAHLVEVEEVEA